jgi:hypothetical protein
MDIGKGFTYVFEDPNWIMKILIGGIVGLIPIVNFALIGYMLTTMKNVADGQPNPMPEWGDFGNHFMKGLYGVVGALIWFSPMIVLFCCMFAITMVGGMAAGGSSGRNGSDAIGGVLGIVVLCFQCVMSLYGLVAGLTFYAPLTRFAMSNNQLSIFWDFRGNLDFVMKNLTNYIIALLVTMVAGFIAGFGVILCVIGVIFTSFWSNMVGAYLFGQMWRASQGQGTVPGMVQS